MTAGCNFQGSNRKRPLELRSEHLPIASFFPSAVNAAVEREAMFDIACPSGK